MEEDIVRNPREAAEVIKAADALVASWKASYTSPASLSDVFEHFQQLGRLLEHLALTLAVFGAVVAIDKDEAS